MKGIKEKTVEYFPHDYHARDDLQEVLQVLGHEGKSVYWDLIEMLYENGGYLEISKLQTYAFTLHSKTEILEKLINDFDLFKKDETNFWSESALRRYAKRLDIAKQRSEAGKKGAGNRWKKESNKPASPPKEKVVYKSFPDTKYVKVTETEYEKIIEKWGQEKAEKMVEVLENWLQIGSKKAKEVRNNPHYAYFRKDSWVSNRADEELKKAKADNGISSDYGKY